MKSIPAAGKNTAALRRAYQRMAAIMPRQVKDMATAERPARAYKYNYINILKCRASEFLLK